MSESPDRLAALFDAVVDLAREERSAYLAKACGDDEQLRSQVERLLHNLDRAGNFLSQAEAAPSARTQPIPSTADKPGDCIGRYKLLEQIGEGGCGVVYMAEQQEPVRRRVALKIIKLGMDTKSVIARFEAERQALALMDHPSIAKVHDAGATDSGRPYFVMELVRGKKITDYCDDKSLSTAERLDLFVKVCQAIQHAHQKGVIHRDIKPSNILVTVNDGVTVPKVIDFGIAKATNDQRLTDKTVFTAFEQFIGTPAYMSPEQAELTSVDIDTRSDIYSLGVLLYELLTGKTPFDSKELLQAGLDEMRRTIREKEPPTPSTRVSTMSGEELTTTAKRRGLEPPKLISQLRGDLDWIVMKCLEKDRGRRYETANGLAMDIQRHVSNEPVVARPPSGYYRLQKLVSRNRLLFGSLCAVILALFLGLGLSTWSFLRESAGRREQARLRREAQTEATKSQQVARFLREMLEGVGPSKAQGRDITMLLEILDKTAERVGKELTNQPEAELEVLHTLENTYQQLGLFKEMDNTAREALRLAREGGQEDSTLWALEQVALAQWELGNYDEAEKMHREVVALRRKQPGRDQAGLAGALNSLALLLNSRGKLPEAEGMFREALTIGRSALGNENSDVASILSNLGMVLRQEGKLAEAETVRREALAMDRKLLSENHPDVAASMHDLATVLIEQGKLSEGETMAREALALRRKLLSNEHSNVAVSLNTLALALVYEGKLAEAESSYDEALTIMRKSLGGQHPNVAVILNGLGFLFDQQGDPRKAEATYREALAINRKQLGDEHPQVAGILDNLGRTLAEQRKFGEAETLCRDRLAGLRARVPIEHPELAMAVDALTDILLREEKFIEGEPLARESLAMREKTPEDWLMFKSRSLLGGTLLGQKRFSEAEPLLLTAYEGMKEREGSIPYYQLRISMRETLARLLKLYELMARPEQVGEWKKKLAKFEAAQTNSLPASPSSAKNQQ